MRDSNCLPRESKGRQSLRMATVQGFNLKATEWTNLGRGPLFLTAPAGATKLAISASGGSVIAKSLEGPAFVIASPCDAAERTGPMSEATGLAILAALLAQNAKIGAVPDGSSPSTVIGLLLAMAGGATVTVPPAPTIAGLAFDFTRTESLLLA